MKTQEEHLAWLLAAEQHPHLKTEAGYQEAEHARQASEALQSDFAEMRDFDQRHPYLIGFAQMPADVRERLQTVLAQHAISVPAASDTAASSLEPIPFEPINETADAPWDTQHALRHLPQLSYRKQFAWAAVLALFLALVSVLSTNVLDLNKPAPVIAVAPARQNYLDEFHQFVSHTARDGFTLDHRAENTVELVSWLSDQQAQVPNLPEPLLQSDGNGCAVREGPRGKISIVCVNVQGQRMQLYIGCARALRSVPKSPEHIVLDGYKAIEWVDEQNAYILMGTDPDADLPEMLL